MSDIKVPPGLTLGEGDAYRAGWAAALAWRAEQDAKQEAYQAKRAAFTGPRWEPLKMEAPG